MNGVACKILLDSGATCTLVRKSLCNGRVFGQKLRLRTANGSWMETLGSRMATIGVGSRCSRVRVHVVDQLAHDCILGIDGLRTLEITLQFSNLKGCSMEMNENVVKEVAEVEAPLDFDIGEETTPEQKQELKLLLAEFEDVFRDFKPGVAKSVKHRIDTAGAEPVFARPHRMPLLKHEIVEKHIKEMLDAGVIQPSSSPYSSPVVLVRKKDNTDRFCVDYSNLNSVTKKDKFPIPRIDYLLDKVKGAKFFTSLDVKSGYWHVPMAEEDMEKTAFSTMDGHFEFRVMPFGLTNAPATFQRFMTTVINGIKFTIVYIDDILVYSELWEDHLKSLREVLQRCRDYNITLKLSKCHFLRPEVRFLGHVINRDGQNVDPEKSRVIEQYPIPKSICELRRYLGMANHYRRFVDHFAQKAAPLYRLLQKGHRWQWTQSEHSAFCEIRDALVRPPVLVYPDSSLDYKLYTDASDEGMGAVLQQDVHGEERVIGYASQRFTSKERKWSTIEQEAAAVIWAIKHFHVYLHGARYKIISDHAPLKWLFKRNNATGRLGRWQAQLLEAEGLDGIEHIRGVDNVVADALSRVPSDEPCRNGEIQVLSDENREYSVSEIRRLQDEDAEKARIQSLKLIDGVWKHEHRVYIPQCIRDRILSDYHGEYGVHFGVQKTYDLMRQIFYWPNMDQSIRNFISNCDICKVSKSVKLESAPLQGLPSVERPFQLIALDFAGPFPTSETGNRYILVVVDHFSRFLKVFPVPCNNGKEAACCLLKTIYEEGVPEKVLTDQGTHFTGSDFQEVLKRFKVKHVRTSPYHPQTDGLAERQMRTIKELLRCKLLSGKPVQWDESLPEIVSEINFSIHRTLGKSPFEVARGRSGTVSGIPWLQFAAKPKQTEEKWSRIQERNEEAAQERRKLRGGTLRIFEKDQYVWLKSPEMKSGLKPKYTGPFRIIERTSPVNYMIDRNGANVVVHVDRLLQARNPNSLRLGLLPNLRGRPRLG